MKEFIEYLVKQIATKPDETNVEEVNENGLYVYKITAAPEDMGILIGKNGNTVRSLRNIAKAKAIRDNVRVRVVVVDQNLPQEDQE